MKRRREIRRRKTKPGVPESASLRTITEDLKTHPEMGPRLSGGDLDADWARGESSGEETVGGSVATPDQDVVDELARALGVEQELDAEVRTSGEVLSERDRMRWSLEDEAEEREGIDGP